MPMKGQSKPRLDDVTEAGIVGRQACTCAIVPQTRGQGQCAACHAWEKNRVLLADGRQVARAAWIKAHELKERTTHHETTTPPA